MYGNMTLLSAELKKLSEILLKLKPWVDGGVLDSRMLESEYSIQVERNQKIQLENEAAEELLKKSIQSADAIVAEARGEAQRIIATSQTQYARLQSKFKEIENRIEDADKKAIKSMMRQAEPVA